MIRAVNVLLAVLGIAGQVALVALASAGLLAFAGNRGTLEAVRETIWGYELWLAFLVSASATAGSLYYSEIAGYIPCELCWFERICMYPLSISTFLLAVAGDHRAARYLLPLPLVGAGLAVYHVLIERGVVGQTAGCSLSAPGGCATKWVDEIGYLTIPTLTLTAFALILAFLALACFDHGAIPQEV